MWQGRELLGIHINNAVTKLNAKTRIPAVHQAYSQGLLTSIIERT